MIFHGASRPSTPSKPAPGALKVMIKFPNQSSRSLIYNIARSLRGDVGLYERHHQRIANNSILNETSDLCFTVKQL